MSTTPQLTPASPPIAKQTTVANYFVSNYPPFSFWKPYQGGLRRFVTFLGPPRSNCNSEFRA